MSTECYVVTVGEYSDYGIVAVYDHAHRSEAQNAADAVGGCVEVYTLNQRMNDPGVPFWIVWMGQDGSLSSVREEPRLRLDGAPKSDVSEVMPTGLREQPGRWKLAVGRYAPDKHKVIKIANELRAQIVAGQVPDCVRDFREI